MKIRTCFRDLESVFCGVGTIYQGELWLKPEHFNSAGNNPYDGAASLSNIRDTCYGNQVKTSWEIKK